MHDPMVIAMEIRRPWPKVRKLRGPVKNRVSLRSPFWRIAGRELYWPGLITVWHVEPDGRDSGEVCKPSTWRRHPHHWRIQVHPVQHFRRWAFTRCAWCGGPSRRGDSVNVSHSWEGEKSAHWWHGQRGVFHRDCSSIEHAHRTCVCDLLEGAWDHNGFSGPWGTCATCGGFRRMGLLEDPDLGVRIETTTLLREIPSGERDSERVATVERLWREHRSSLNHEGKNPA